MKYTRAELWAIIETRRRAGDSEGRGDNSFLDLRIRITPEMLASVMDAEIRFADGSVAMIDCVYVNDDGYAEPILSRRTPEVSA